MVKWTEIDDFATSIDVMKDAIRKDHIAKLYTVDGEDFKNLIFRIKDEGIEYPKLLVERLFGKKEEETE